MSHAVPPNASQSSNAQLPEVFDPKTILITGAGSGIGQTTALEFARRGYHVIVADIDIASALATAKQIQFAGGKAETESVDIGDSASVNDLFDRLRTRHTHLHAAFNNAGIGGNGKPLAELEEAEWAQLLNINLSGCWRCMRHEINWMLESGSGCIVNNSSIFGLVGGANAAYTATKHGIAGLTRSAALTYAARNIRVNAVCPGLIESGMGLRVLERLKTQDIPSNTHDVIALHPVRRAGTASEVAKAVAWLCSDDASFVHGHLLSVDGGYSAR